MTDWFFDKVIKQQEKNTDDIFVNFVYIWIDIYANGT